MKLGNIAASLAGAALVFAPVAASAGTKAADVKVTSGAKMGSRASSRVAQKSKDGSGLLIGLAAAVVIGGGIILATDDGKTKGA